MASPSFRTRRPSARGSLTQPLPDLRQELAEASRELEAADRRLERHRTRPSGPHPHTLAWLGRAHRRVANAEALVAARDPISDEHLRHGFFETFRDYAHRAGFHGDWHGSRVLRRREGPIAFGARVRANSGEAELLIDSGDRRTNERIFEAVSRYAHTTSSRLAETLRWDDKDERQRFKVSASERPFGYADRSSWQQTWDAYLGDVLDLERFLRPGLPSDVPSTAWAPRLGSRLATQTRTLGAQYRPADETRSSTRLPLTVDPDAIDRGTRAHSTTQNLLAVALTRAGLTPRSPRIGEPDFDLAWERDGTWFVAEVKSLAPANESMQLRLGLGQVLDYRHALAQRHRRVEAVLMVEREPTVIRWADLCRESGVTLLWPSIVDPFLSRAA